MSFGMLIVGIAPEYSFYFFSGDGTYVIYRCREKSPTVPSKSLWLLCLAVPSPTDFIDWKAHIHMCDGDA